MDFVSGKLMEFGLKRGQLLGDCIVHLQTECTLTNQVVVDLENFRSNEQLSKQFTVRWLKCLSENSQSQSQSSITEHRVKKTVEKYRTLGKLQRSDPQKLQTFLASAFLQLCDAAPTSRLKPPSRASPCAVHKAQKETETLQHQLVEQGQKLVMMEGVIGELSTENLELFNMQKKATTSKSNSTELHKKHEDLKTKYELKRREQYETGRQLAAQKQQVTTTQHHLESLTTQHAEIVAGLQKQLDKVQRRNAALVQENLALLQEDRPVTIQTTVPRENNRFSDEIRRTVLTLQAEGNVPATRCADVIRIVSSTLFNVHIPASDLPCPQTSINISGEGAVLASVQATEAVLNSENCTLHTDGTSRSQKKFVSQQFTLDNKVTITLGHRTVAAEDAVTLLDITIKQLEEMSDLYADATDQDKDTIYKSLLTKLTSLMSDRAAVMKKFNRDFHAFVQTQLGQDIAVHFLHCNAHFLLGLSRACETGMKEAEGADKLGRDKHVKYRMFAYTAEGATSRLIRTASALTGPQGDQKNGCREEWLACCDRWDIKSRMTSYRSNRFNSYFEGAAAVVHHREDLVKFFPNLPHSNLKTQC